MHCDDDDDDALRVDVDDDDDDDATRSSAALRVGSRQPLGACSLCVAVLVNRRKNFKTIIEMFI